MQRVVRVSSVKSTWEIDSRQGGSLHLRPAEWDPLGLESRHQFLQSLHAFPGHTMASDKRFLNTLLIRLPFSLDVILCVAHSASSLIAVSSSLILNSLLCIWEFYDDIFSTGPSRKACVFLIWFLDFLSYSNVAIVSCVRLLVWSSGVLIAGQTYSLIDPLLPFLSHPLLHIP